MDVPALAAAAQRVVAGEAGGQELLEALLSAIVVCEAPAQPGVVPAQTPSGPVVAVHSDVAQLAAARGAVAWFSCTGRDLLDLLPEGHDLLLDPAAEHALLLRTTALRRAVHVS